jgi:hypothetical protein
MATRFALMRFAPIPCLPPMKQPEERARGQAAIFQSSVVLFFAEPVSGSAAFSQHDAAFLAPVFVDPDHRPGNDR